MLNSRSSPKNSPSCSLLNVSWFLNANTASDFAFPSSITFKLTS